jgi:hypothetical protein
MRINQLVSCPKSDRRDRASRFASMVTFRRGLSPHFFRHALRLGLIVIAALSTPAAAAYAQGFNSSVTAGVIIGEGGPGDTVSHSGTTAASALLIDATNGSHSGDADGFILMSPPVTFHATADAIVGATSVGQVGAGSTLDFTDELHGMASDSLKIQIANGDFRFYILESVHPDSVTGQGSETLNLHVTNSLGGHGVVQAFGSGNLLELDLDAADEFSLLSGGLIAENTMSVGAHADANPDLGNPVYNSSWDFSDTAYLFSFFLVDQNGNPVNGLTITGDSGIQYPVNQPLPVPEPSALMLLGIGAGCLVVRVGRKGKRTRAASVVPA